MNQRIKVALLVVVTALTCAPGVFAEQGTSQHPKRTAAAAGNPPVGKPAPQQNMPQPDSDAIKALNEQLKTFGEKIDKISEDTKGIDWPTIRSIDWTGIKSINWANVPQFGANPQPSEPASPENRSDSQNIWIALAVLGIFIVGLQVWIILSLLPIKRALLDTNAASPLSTNEQLRRRLNPPPRNDDQKSPDEASSGNFGRRAPILNDATEFVPAPPPPSERIAPDETQLSVQTDGWIEPNGIVAELPKPNTAEAISGSEGDEMSSANEDVILDDYYRALASPAEAQAFRQKYQPLVLQRSQSGASDEIRLSADSATDENFASASYWAIRTSNDPAKFLVFMGRYWRLNIRFLTADSGHKATEICRGIFNISDTRGEHLTIAPARARALDGQNLLVDEMGLVELR